MNRVGVATTPNSGTPTPLGDIEGVPRRGRAYPYELDAAIVDAGARTATIENAGGRNDDAFAQTLAISAR